SVPVREIQVHWAAIWDAKNCGQPVPPVVQAAWNALSSQYPNTQVTVHHSHGDFAPWNILELADGRLYIFDWEYAAERPALHDQLHFAFTTGRLLGGLSQNEIVRRLVEVARAAQRDIADPSEDP